MKLLVRNLFLVLALVVAVGSTAAAQVVQGSGATLLRVTVLDQTDAALISQCRGRK